MKLGLFIIRFSFRRTTAFPIQCMLIVSVCTSSIDLRTLHDQQTCDTWTRNRRNPLLFYRQYARPETKQTFFRQQTQIKGFQISVEIFTLVTVSSRLSSNRQTVKWLCAFSLFLSFAFWSVVCTGYCGDECVSASEKSQQAFIGFSSLARQQLGLRQELSFHRIKQIKNRRACLKGVRKMKKLWCTTTFLPLALGGSTRSQKVKGKKKLCA